MALGAAREAIVGGFLAKGLGVTGASCIAGLALALAFTRLLSGMLYGVSTSDPATLSGVILLVLAVGSMASLLPAIRAAKVEPMKVLRDE
jgi:ABC-type antimicrobial peptide transport system permease subunit